MSLLAGLLVALGSPVGLAAPSDSRVVVFLSAKCPCSQSHESALRGLHNSFASRGVKFEGVHSNQDESAELARGHFARAKLGFAVVHDPGAKRANELGAVKTPHAFVLVNGQVVYRGGIDNSREAGRATEFFLRDAIEAAVSGRTPQVAEARALGCVIKR